MLAYWFETRGVAALLTMRVNEEPHPEERPPGRVSKDEATEPENSSRRRSRETVGLELVAQRGLEDLSGRGVRDGVDEHDVVRHPPFGDLAVHGFQDVLARRPRALLELHDQKRTLVPFRKIAADYVCLGDRRISDQAVLQIDRGRTLRTRLDQLLRAIGDPHVSLLVDSCN